MCRRRHGDRARSRRWRLPHPALPDARRHLSRAVDADDLDVRAARESVDASRAAGRYGVSSSGSPSDDSVRVADRDGHELTSRRPSRARRRRPRRDLARCHRSRADDSRPARAIATRTSIRVRPDRSSQPGGRDARPVARELGLRPVRVPDGDVDGVAALAEDLEDAVGAPVRARTRARGVERGAGPARRRGTCYRERATSRIASTTCSEGRSASIMTMPGNPPHPLPLVRGVAPRANDDPLARLVGGKRRELLEAERLRRQCREMGPLSACVDFRHDAALEHLLGPRLDPLLERSGRDIEAHDERRAAHLLATRAGRQPARATPPASASSSARTTRRRSFGWTAAAAPDRASTSLA